MALHRDDAVSLDDADAHSSYWQACFLMAMSALSNCHRESETERESGARKCFATLFHKLNCTGCACHRCCRQAAEDLSFQSLSLLSLSFSFFFFLCWFFNYLCLRHVNDFPWNCKLLRSLQLSRLLQLLQLPRLHVHWLHYNCFGFIAHLDL